MIKKYLRILWNFFKLDIECKSMIIGIKYFLSLSKKFVFILMEFRIFLLQFIGDYDFLLKTWCNYDYIYLEFRRLKC